MRSIQSTITGRRAIQMWTWLEPMRASKLSYIRNPHLLTLTERVYEQSTERIPASADTVFAVSTEAVGLELKDVETSREFLNVVLDGPNIFLNDKFLLRIFRKNGLSSSA